MGLYLYDHLLSIHCVLHANEGIFTFQLFDKWFCLRGYLLKRLHKKEMSLQTCVMSLGGY
jgi:hypothetical protein